MSSENISGEHALIHIINCGIKALSEDTIEIMEEMVPMLLKNLKKVSAIITKCEKWIDRLLNIKSLSQESIKILNGISDVKKLYKTQGKSALKCYIMDYIQLTDEYIEFLVNINTLIEEVAGKELKRYPIDQ